MKPAPSNGELLAHLGIIAITTICPPLAIIIFICILFS